MYVNTRLLKDLGLTFPKSLDELLKQGPAIAAKGLIPIAMDNKDGWQMQSCLLSGLARAHRRQSLVRQGAHRQGRLVL